MLKRKRGVNKQMEGGCLSLFGLPFLVAGLFLTWMYFSGYADWWRARGWVETPCWIDTTKLKESRGDDSTSYQANATYHYEYGGKTYQSDRVSFGKGSDNVGDFQKSAHRELSSHLASDGREAKQFRCYVNPAKPDESVIYRDLRWQMQLFFAIFTLTFPAVGAGLVIGGQIAARHKRREDALRQANPDEPWRWKTAWSGTSIPEASGPWKMALYAYTAWSALILIPLVVATVSSGAFGRDAFAWPVLIPVMLWLLPAWFSFKRWRQVATIGRTRFEMAEMPARGGKTLAGAFLLEKPLPARADALADLKCLKKITRNTGDGDTTLSETLWQQQAVIPQDLVTRDISGFRLPVSFALPADAPPTGDTEDPLVRHEWQLKLTVPGRDYTSDFEVPVFEGDAAATHGETSGTVAGHATPSLEALSEANLPSMLAARKIRAEFDANGLPVSIVCPAARHTSLILFLTIFNLIWIGATIMIFTKGAPLIFKIMWPVFQLITIWWLAWELLHSRSTTFSGESVEVIDRYGPFTRKRVLEKRSITSFDHHSNMSSGDQRFYQVRAHEAIGRKTTLVDGITESLTAEAMVKRLEDWKTGS